MRRTLLLLALCSVIVLGSSPASAQDESGPDAKAYKIRQIKLRGFTGQFVDLLAWRVMDKSNSLVIADDYDEMNEKSSVRSFKLTSKGKAGSSQVIFDVGGGQFRDGVGFWFRGEPPTIGSALVVLAYTAQGSSTVRLTAGLLDDAGKVWIDFNTIAEFTPPEDSYFSGVWTVGAKKNGSVGVFVFLWISETSDTYYGQRACKAYYMEINADTSLATPTPVEIKLPNGGDYRQAEPFRPVWTGQRWLLPVVMISLTPELYEGKYHPNYSGYQLYLAAVTPGGGGDSLKVKFNRIAKDKSTRYWSPFPTPLILATSTGAPAAVGADASPVALLYAHATANNQAGAGYHSKLFSYYLQPINDAGRKSGKKRKLGSPVWNRHYELGADYDSESTYSYFSNPIADSDGRFLIALSRAATVNRKSDSQFLSELQLDFYSFDPVSGEGVVLATANYLDKWLFHPPLLRMFDSVARVMNRIVDEKPSGQEDNLYISRF